MKTIYLRLELTLQIAVPILFIFFILYQFNIFPVYLILGIVGVLFLPGYNLIKIIKPNLKFSHKLGYSSIFSLLISNLLMFAIYLVSYDLLPGKKFFFNDQYLMILIQIFNLLFVLVYLIKYSLSRTSNANQLANRIQLDEIINKSKQFNKIHGCIFILYCFFLLLVCLATYFSYLPESCSIQTNLIDYSYDFTFFLRVNYLFYIFLFLSLTFLIYIILNFTNINVKLIAVSLFLYSLWILPYLQIKFYYNHDSYILGLICTEYFNKGFKADWGLFSFLVYSDTWRPTRYSTSILSTLLIVFSTNLDVNYAIWFIFPLIFVFIPFLMHNIFEYFGKNDLNMEKKKVKMIVITIFSILTPQFIRFAHSATTGVIGIIIFIMLTIELYNYTITDRSLIKKSFIIVILFSFLCLTHIEESIYFIVLYFIFGLYLTYKMSRNSIQNEKYLSIKKIRYHIILGTVILLIFYWVSEFFGYFSVYLSFIMFEDSPLSNIVLSIYENTKFFFITSMKNNFKLSLFIIVSTVIFLLLYSIVLYLINSKRIKFPQKIFDFGYKIIKLSHKLLIKIIDSKFFNFIFIPAVFLAIFSIDILIIRFTTTNLLLNFIVTIFTYTLFVIQILLFVDGIKNYELNNFKQIFFILGIISSASIWFVFIIVGNFYLGFYIFHSYFLTILIIYNLIIIQSRSDLLEKIFNKRRILLFGLLLVLFLFGIFYSLKGLRFG